MSSSVAPKDGGVKLPVNKNSAPKRRRLLIHWKGERNEGYSKQFRQLEFVSALEAVVGINVGKSLGVRFENALDYKGDSDATGFSIESYNDAMQYIKISEYEEDIITRESIREAVQRCSLVHALYEFVAEGATYDELATSGIDDGGLQDLFKGNENENVSWCFRVRNFGELASEDKEKRSGARARSLRMEKEGLKKLKPLLIQIGGKVDLMDPDCKIFIFDGLENVKKVLTRQIASGPRISSINPNTRICVTTTPLCPIAAFSLCNVARIQPGHAVLDPYAGSCATLLAASMIAPTCQTVGVEICHNGLVNRDDVRKDFQSRQLTLPKAIIFGDSTDPGVRKEARKAIGGGAFDSIVADPPYGIRESSYFSDITPLEELMGSIAKDRDAGARLLKNGGRLVAFVPVTEDQSLQGVLPNSEIVSNAGLQFEVCREQRLNEKLSRWLVSYICIK